MKRISLHPILLLIVISLNLSCSLLKKKDEAAFFTKTTGFIRNEGLGFPIYFTEKIIPRAEIEAKTAKDVFIIHPGHILSSKKTKEENEATLQALVGKGIDLVNLTLEDFMVARAQEINFELYPQNFLNSSVFNINDDSLIESENIKNFFIHEGVAIIGLSDQKLSQDIEDFGIYILDYTYSILSSKKNALEFEKKNETPLRPLHSLIVVHSLGEEINEVIDRLPANFMTSLTD